MTPIPTARERIARLIYESDPIYESGESIDGHQVTPGGDLSWEQFIDRSAEFGDDKLFHGWSDRLNALYALADLILSDRAGEGGVSIPTSIAEAELMEKLGFAWLAENAPERLTEAGLLHSTPSPTGFTEEEVERAARAYEESLLGPFAAKIELNRDRVLERRCEAMRAALSTLAPHPSREEGLRVACEALLECVQEKPEPHPEPWYFVKPGFGPQHSAAIEAIRAALATLAPSREEGLLGGSDMPPFLDNAAAQDHAAGNCWHGVSLARSCAWCERGPNDIDPARAALRHAGGGK